MTATVLREAARLMRERAEAATPGPWTWREEHGRDAGGEWTLVPIYAPSAGVLADLSGFDSENAQADAAHVASWHPTVALAVADWLERVARLIEGGFYPMDEDNALAVARAYLSDSPSPAVETPIPAAGEVTTGGGS